MEENDLDPITFSLRKSCLEVADKVSVWNGESVTLDCTNNDISVFLPELDNHIAEIAIWLDLIPSQDLGYWQMLHRKGLKSMILAI